MNNRKCFRCSFIERAEADCPACHGTNRIFGKCFKCPVCEGYGKWCSICDYKGYLKEKYIKCPNCKGKTSCIQCPVCHDKLIIPDTDSTIFVLELSPRSHPSKDTIKRFIFFKNCRHFDKLQEKIINTKCQCCGHFEPFQKGINCQNCNLSFCSACLNKVGLDNLIDSNNHKMIGVKYNIQKCSKCKGIYEECLSFDCLICKTHICGNCLFKMSRSKLLSLASISGL